MSIRHEARAQALVEYAHGKVRDRYDADLMMAGFEDGAAWQAKREPANPIEVNDAMAAVPEAAMPAIREQIAQEIEAYSKRVSDDPFVTGHNPTWRRAALYNLHEAARIARGES